MPRKEARWRRPPRVYSALGRCEKGMRLRFAPPTLALVIEGWDTWKEKAQLDNVIGQQSGER